MEEAQLCLVLLSGFLLVNSDVTKFRLQIEPSHAYLKTGENLTVMCKAPVPLSQCQLYGNQEYYDASLGDQSLPENGFTYQGRGLEHGECGFQIDGDAVFTENTTYAISCRARSDRSDWMSAVMPVHKNSEVRGNFTVDHRVQMVAPGSSVKVVYKVESRFSTCQIYDKNSSLYLDLTSGNCTDDGNLCGLGDTGKDLECGFTIKNVTEEYNDMIWLQVLGVNETELLHDFLILMVVESPNKVVLTMNLTTTEDGRQMLTAECVVQNSRPAANVSWFLGEDPLESLEVMNMPASLSVKKWAKISSLRTTRQWIVRYLDNTEWGKDLWCQAGHSLLPEGLSSNRIRLQEDCIPDRYCQPLKSDSVLISCYLGAVKKKCQQPQRVGTIARLQCRSGYTLSHSTFYREIYCLESGRWNKDVFTCYPDCGRRIYNAGVGLVSNGEAAVTGEFPWHVSIYRNTGSEYKQLCGGSLITPDVVLTAAHCFWDNSINMAFDQSEFRVAAGKINRAWEDNDSGVQHREIARIDTNDFGGTQRGLAYDIALVFLQRPVEITDTVNIVCIDGDGLVELTHLQAGNIGVVPGWGLTEEGLQSDTLRYIELPYIPRATCYAALPVIYRPSLTNDKFCAGYRNKSKSVCGGDSGGGLVFLETGVNRYYLRGIVSISFKPRGLSSTVCYAEQYTAFTRLSQDYLRWIQRNT